MQGTGALEETGTLTKLTVSLQKGEGVGGAEPPPANVLLPRDSAPSSGLGAQGMIVQVKERFQGRSRPLSFCWRMSHQLPEGSGIPWKRGRLSSLTCSITRQRNCEKSVSQLVEFPGDSLLQQQGRAAAFAWGTAVEKGAAPLGIRSSASPRTDHPTDTDSLSAGWSVGGGTRSILSAPQTGPWTVEHSASSSLPDQLRGQSCTEPARVGRVPLRCPDCLLLRRRIISGRL